MKITIPALAILFCCATLDAQDNTFRGSVLSYQWTTTHTGKGKEEWIKFDMVHQTAIAPQQAHTTSAQLASNQGTSQAVSTQAAASSIEALKPSSDSGFPRQWKSMTTGNSFTVRLERDYLHAKRNLLEAAVKAGMFFLIETKKDGGKYVGKANGRVLKTENGPACSINLAIEFTSVTPERIEGRAISALPNAKFDWHSCSWSPALEWQPFVWIPVK